MFRRAGSVSDRSSSNSGAAGFREGRRACPAVGVAAMAGIPPVGDAPGSPGVLLIIVPNQGPKSPQVVLLLDGTDDAEADHVGVGQPPDAFGVKRFLFVPA